MYSIIKLMNNNEKYSPSYGGKQGSRHNHQFGRTTTKYTSQPTILRLYRQSYRTTERENHGLLSRPPPSLPVPTTSLPVPHTLPPSIFLPSVKQFALNKLPWLNKVCSLSVPLTLSLSISPSLSPSLPLSLSVSLSLFLSSNYLSLSNPLSVSVTPSVSPLLSLFSAHLQEREIGKLYLMIVLMPPV